MAIAVVLVLLVVGSLIFHFVSPWWFTPIASNWATMDDTVVLTFWVTGIVFIAVNLFLAWVVCKYRHRKGHKADYEPENKKLEWWLTIVTSIGVAAMLAPGLFVWGKFVEVPEDAAIVEASASNGTGASASRATMESSATATRRSSRPTIPSASTPRIRSAATTSWSRRPELHLPVDQPVKVLLRSKDVLHNFTVTQFRVKMDLVPGMITYLWLTPTVPGVIRDPLRGAVRRRALRDARRVVVTPREEFDAWLAALPTFGETQALAAADPAAGAASTRCARPATARGRGQSRAQRAAARGPGGLVPAPPAPRLPEGLRGAHERDTYGAQMRAFAAMLPDDTSIRNVAAYIQSLPGQSAGGDGHRRRGRGRRLYATCASCHGREGQGIWALNAPRLAEMSDWYLVRQLQNFQHGVRGAHRQDYYGWQMATFADSLKDERGHQRRRRLHQHAGS